MTGTFALPFTAYFGFLSLRVVRQRIKSNTLMGDKSSEDKSDALFAASRAHVNFAENVPLALALAAVAELNGASRQVLTYMLSTLFVLRVAHAEGITAAGNKGVGRPVGYFGSLGVMTGLAGYTAYLVKGYWGF